MTPSQIAIHTITTKPWSTEECIENYAKAGIGGITFWRYSFDGRNPESVGRQARDAGLEVVSVARGGFFPAVSKADRQSAVEENLRAIDESSACGAASLVLVCGSVTDQSLEDSREQIKDGIAACLDHAKAANVILAIEPLHPMYADDRSAVNTMAQASDICAKLDNHNNIGIACDVYHTWWDPDLKNQIHRAAENGNFTAYHICDWKTPTTDFLNDRGLMGEGCIDLNQIGNWVDKAGFKGFHEVEIFSDTHWAQDQHQYLERIIHSCKNL